MKFHYVSTFYALLHIYEEKLLLSSHYLVAEVLKKN